MEALLDRIQNKKCFHCGEEKPISDFYHDKSRSSGIYPWCKDCSRDYSRQGELWKSAWVPPQNTKRCRERVYQRGRKKSYPFFLQTRFKFNIPQKWTLTFRYSTVFGLSPKAEELKVRLAHELEKEMKGKKIYNNKLWIVMTICKPRVSHRNEYYVQLISQVVQHVTKLSSTWYCYRIDWVIDKTEPGVVLSLIQIEAVDRKICSYCGEVLLTKYMVTNSRLKLGVSNVCKWCEAIQIKEIGARYRARTKAAFPYSRATRNRKKGISSPV